MAAEKSTMEKASCTGKDHEKGSCAGKAEKK
jgi:hypothetical protein